MIRKTIRKIRVLLADDHAVVRAGFRRLLETAADIDVVGEAGSGAEAMRMCSELSPDVTVMDLSMPEIGGLDAIAGLDEQKSGTRVLVLSVHENEPFPSMALRRGAMGYLTKRCAPDELIAAVRKVASGKRYLAKDIAEKLALGQPSEEGAALEELTRREFQVFSHLARGESVNEIARKLFLSPKTVHVHRANVLKKLNASSAAELVRIAIRHGIVDP